MRSGQAAQPRKICYCEMIFMNEHENNGRKLFGTDGIRGRANHYPMTPELALKLGKATAIFFKRKDIHPRIVVGKDTRISGYMLETAMTSGLVSMGATVFLVGPLPTPAISHLTRSLNVDAGI